jgi:RNA polymerase sigma factor (sigma-70 family)
MVQRSGFAARPNTMKSISDEALATAASAGDTAALAELCARLETPVFRLCLRLLGNPAEAEDAAQDVMVKVITHLSTFEGASALRTWVHRIAVRHVWGRTPDNTVDEATFDALLEKGLAYGASQPAPTPEESQLAREVCLSCTQGMLHTLNRDERLALVLVELLGLDGHEAADVAECSAAAFRQRLSRARLKLGAFLQRSCGVVQPKAACRCDKQIAGKRALGLTEPKLQRLACDDLPHPSQTVEALDELQAVRAIHQAFQRDGLFAAPATLRTKLQHLLPSVVGARGAGVTAKTSSD